MAPPGSRQCARGTAGQQSPRIAARGAARCRSRRRFDPFAGSPPARTPSSTPRGPARPRPARGGGRRADRKARRRPCPGDSGRANGAAANRVASTEEGVGEQRDDGTDLIADQRADCDAEHSPERTDDDRSEHERHRVRGCQRDTRVADREDRTSRTEGQTEADDGEDDPHQRGRGELGPEDDATARLEEQRRADRPVTKLAGDDEDACDRREEHDDAPAEHQLALSVLLRQLLERRRQPSRKTPNRLSATAARNTNASVRVVRSLRSSERT